ncbi:hypothetical protein A9X06_09280 [Mycobacterium sp. 852002-51759_SCH5129042]|nr:hypothetical protein A9X06_09280 [Mycobacterium sp. 852002-51759_SCH5129042]
MGIQAATGGAVSNGKGRNESLARLLNELEISNKGLAHRICERSQRDGGKPVKTGHTAIARYISGEYTPSDRNRQLLIAVLSEKAGRAISGDEIGYPDRAIDPDPADEKPVSDFLASPGFASLPIESVDPLFVDHLKIQLAERVRMDALTGPLYVVKALGSELSMIEDMCGRARGEMRESLLEVGARFAEFAGWLYQDAGDLKKSMYWTNTANDYAEELGDPHLISYILGRKSNIATERGYAAKGLGLANAALRRWDELTPELRAVALRQRAHAYAMTGETDECRRALDEAMVQVLSIDAGHPDRLALYCTPSYIEMEAAHAWVRLGRPELAIETYQVGLADWPAEQRRDKGLCAARLAAAYAGFGEFEAAGRGGVEALQLVRSAPSSRSLDVLRTLADQVGHVKNEATAEFKAAMASVG